jgi:thiamine biosynthesis lipoprotein
VRTPQPDGGLDLDGPRGLRDVRRFSHEAMATIFEVYGVHPDAEYAAQAAQAAFDLADRLEHELSRFLPNSDIGRINHLAAGEHTQVSPSTMECLVIARHMFDLTGGAFDVSLGTGLPSLDLDADGCLVRAATGGVRLDLGGIGKGYAVDLMAEVLEEWGLDRALVHGGFSSVLALDAPARGEGWPLTLSDPAPPCRVLVRRSARQMAFGASGLRKGDHILDPRTAEPVRGRRAAWVSVPRPEAARAGTHPQDGPRVAPAAVADALTTAFMLVDSAAVESLCERSPGLEAWLLLDAADGRHEEAALLHFGSAIPEPPRAAGGS